MKISFAKIKIPSSLALLLISILTSNANTLRIYPTELPQVETQTDIHPADVIHWKMDHATSYPDGTVMVGLRLETKQDFSLYTDKVTFTSSSGYFLSQIIPPKKYDHMDPVTNKTVQVYKGGEFFLLFSGLNQYQKKTFPLSIKYLGCTSLICLFPFTEIFDLRSFPSTEPYSMLFKQRQETSKKEENSNKSTENNSSEPLNFAEDMGFEDTIGSKIKEGDTSFFWLIIFALIGGLLTNLTPCVYPMIPITVRLLANQTKQPLLGSAAYALGIVLTYTILGVFATLTGSMFGSLMASASLNLFFAGIMMLLGISMLGFGNLGALQTIGNKIGAGKAGMRNAFFMGTGAGLVASPCTGPILGALLAYSASHTNLFQSTILLLIYSIGFGIPYIFLGGAAANISKIQVPPYIQVAVKLFFSAVMFALAFYYLRIPVYGVVKSLAQHWPIITLCGMGIGLIGSAIILFSSTLHNKNTYYIIPAVTLGLGFFAGTQWIANSHSQLSKDKLSWIYQEDAALKLAKKSNSPILIDMWAEWCEACKKMDATTFSSPKMIDYFIKNNWVLLKLDLTESTDQNDLIQKRFNIKGLPTLVIIPNAADPNKFFSIAGYIDDENLRKKLDKYKKD